MELGLLHHLGLSGNQLTLVAPGLDVKILSFFLLILANLIGQFSVGLLSDLVIHLLYSLLNNCGKILNDREKLDNFGEDDQTVPDLYKVFALKTDHQSLGNLVVPLVTDVPKIQDILAQKKLSKSQT